MRLNKCLLAALVVLGTMSAAWAQDTRTQIVKFPPGKSGTTIEDSIKGRESVKYSVGVSAGQRMSVQLDTSNPGNYFNITAPGASEALFNGSISGSSTSFVIPSSGNYVIDVYLMRNAARRNEAADYSLNIYVENGKGTSQQRPAQQDKHPQGETRAPSELSLADMPRFCQGEASAAFGIRPRELSTLPAEKAGKEYIVFGNYDGPKGLTMFRCYFNIDGQFIAVN